MRKIAAVTEDGQRISSHFGMAPRYHVFSVVEGQIVQEETRPKPHHGQHPEGDHSHEHEPGHGSMFAPIADCQVLLVGGMGEPAYRSALDAGLEVILAGGEIRPQVEAYLRGDIQSDARRVHRH